MSDCIFCKILAGEIPSARVYEDDDFVAFLDIRPINRGHVLVVPRIHAQYVTELPDEVLARELPVAARIARAVVAATGLTAFNLFNSNGEVSGQEVFHHHLHIIPRREGDGLHLRLDPESYAPGEMAGTADRIRQNLA